MNCKIVKNESDYAEAVARLEHLGDCERLSAEEADEMEFLTLTLEKYDRENNRIDLPDPVEAIKFRMEQENLSRKDMAVYLGSEAKVSEVLNRKISLSLNMVRALAEGLDIPVEVLIQKPENSHATVRYSVRDYPFVEMFKRGYFNFTGALREAREKAEELLEDFFSDYNVEPNFMYCRKRDGDSDVNALKAWHCRVRHRMDGIKPVVEFGRKSLSDEFCRRLAALSCYSEGPKMAMEQLASIGVTVLIERHLPKTYLDGATFMMDDGRPVIGLTLRYDRWDNFWFTLMHEVGHLRLHQKAKGDCFMDNIDSEVEAVGDEREANEFAANMLIPQKVWADAMKRLLATRDAEVVEAFSRKNFVSADIVAGRIRRETGDYARFRKLNRKVERV